MSVAELKLKLLGGNLDRAERVPDLVRGAGGERGETQEARGLVLTLTLAPERDAELGDEGADRERGNAVRDPLPRSNLGEIW